MSYSFEANPRLLVDIRHESNQIFEPITCYEQEPLVSLEEACQPLGTILGIELKLYITVAKLNSKEPKNGLTQDESASIYLYTMEWNEMENSLFALLNQTLCTNDRRQLQPWLKYLKLFFTAFVKLPCTDYRTVWRGTAVDLSGLYREGDEVIWRSLSSSASSFDVLQSPMYFGRADTRTMFSVETKNGKLIREHSHLQNDDEILLPPGIVLQVTASLNLDNGTHIIYLHEIESCSSRLAQPHDLRQMNETSLPNEQVFLGAHIASNIDESTPLDLYRNLILEEKIYSSEPRSKLDLDGMRLNDWDMEIVANLGICDKKCMALYLRNNEITSTGVSFLAQALNGNTTLKTILLGGNRISDAGVKSLARALTTEDSGVRTLYLVSIGMTDAGCEYLANMIRINHTIMFLHVKNNEISDRGVRVLCEVIGSRDCGISILTLSGNKFTDASVNVLCSTISRDSSLRQLHVSDCIYHREIKNDFD